LVFGRGGVVEISKTDQLLWRLEGKHYVYIRDTDVRPYE